jgi:FKBP-type peptidyl-prolyl cis-trans isomerase (trigger factor)
LRVDVRDSETAAWEKVLTIEVPPEELDEDYNAILEDYRRRAVLPGFRKGHVPRNVLELQFGHSLEHEVLERAVKRSYERAMKEQDLHPISYPSIDKIRFDKGKPLSFEAKVEVRPAVTPKDYFGLEIETKETAVPDDEVDKALEDLRQRAADWAPIEREAAVGDAVVVDYRRLNAKGKPIHRSEQKDALVELDAQGLLPEFRQNLLGKKVGDHVTFDVTYPEDFANQELRSKKVTFALDMKGVRERRVRALDDSFATEVRVSTWMADAVSVPQGERVGDLVVRLASGRELEFPLRAGLEAEIEVAGLQELLPGEVQWPRIEFERNQAAIDDEEQEPQPRHDEQALRRRRVCVAIGCVDQAAKPSRRMIQRESTQKPP